jgi:hypothetical protein
MGRLGNNATERENTGSDYSRQVGRCSPSQTFGASEKIGTVDGTGDSKSTGASERIGTVDGTGDSKSTGASEKMNTLIVESRTPNSILTLLEYDGERDESVGRNKLIRFCEKNGGGEIRGASSGGMN